MDGEDKTDSKRDDEGFVKPEDNLFIQNDNYYEDQGLISKIKRNLGMVIIVVLMFIGVINMMFLWGSVSTMKDIMLDVTKKIEGIDLKGVKAQMTELESKIENIKRENENVKAEMLNIKNELENIKAKKAKSELTPQHKPVKKKPVKRSRSTNTGHSDID